MADPHQQNGGTSRRGFLDVLLGVGIVAWLASIVYPVVRYLKPLPISGQGGPIELDKAEMSTLESNKKFVILRSEGKRIIVLEDPQEKLHALSAKCTHEGCTVRYVPGQNLIWCPCHNGKYSISGRVLSGPPPRPLAEYTIKRDKKGDVFVVTSDES